MAQRSSRIGRSSCHVSATSLYMCRFVTSQLPQCQNPRTKMDCPLVYSRQLLSCCLFVFSICVLLFSHLFSMWLQPHQCLCVACFGADFELGWSLLSVAAVFTVEFRVGQGRNAKWSALVAIDGILLFWYCSCYWRCAWCFWKIFIFSLIWCVYLLVVKTSAVASLQCFCLACLAAYCWNLWSLGFYFCFSFLAVLSSSLVLCHFPSVSCLVSRSSNQSPMPVLPYHAFKVSLLISLLLVCCMWLLCMLVLLLCLSHVCRSV